MYMYYCTRLQVSTKLFKNCYPRYDAETPDLYRKLGFFALHVFVLTIFIIALLVSMHQIV